MPSLGSIARSSRENCEACLSPSQFSFARPQYLVELLSDRENPARSLKHTSHQRYQQTEPLFRGAICRQQPCPVAKKQPLSRIHCFPEATFRSSSDRTNLRRTHQINQSGACNAPDSQDQHVVHCMHPTLPLQFSDPGHGRCVLGRMSHLGASRVSSIRRCCRAPAPCRLMSVHSQHRGLPSAGGWSSGRRSCRQSLRCAAGR